MEGFLTVDVAKAARLALLGMMETASPIHSDIAFLSVQSSSSFHASPSTDSTELEQAVEYRAIIPDIETTLLFRVVLHVVWGDFLQKIDVLVGVELGHFVVRGRFCALDEVQ